MENCKDFGTVACGPKTFTILGLGVHERIGVGLCWPPSMPGMGATCYINAPPQKDRRSDLLCTVLHRIRPRINEIAVWGCASARRNRIAEGE